MRRNLAIVVASLLLLTITGCSPSNSEIKENSSNTYEAPKDAIKIKDDLYYVPIARDKDGCMMYKAYSETNYTVQAILYSTKDGKFSMNKNKEYCE